MKNDQAFPMEYVYHIFETEIQGAKRVRASDKVVKKNDLIIYSAEELERRKEHISDLPYFELHEKPNLSENE